MHLKLNHSETEEALRQFFEGLGYAVEAVKFEYKFSDKVETTIHLEFMPGQRESLKGDDDAQESGTL